MGKMIRKISVSPTVFKEKPEELLPYVRRSKVQVYLTSNLTSVCDRTKPYVCFRMQPYHTVCSRIIFAGKFYYENCFIVQYRTMPYVRSYHLGKNFRTSPFKFFFFSLFCVILSLPCVRILNFEEIIFVQSFHLFYSFL